MRPWVSAKVSESSSSASPASPSGHGTHRAQIDTAHIVAKVQVAPPGVQRRVRIRNAQAARQVVGAARGNHQQRRPGVSQRRQNAMHRAVAAKHHGHVRQIVGLQRVAAKHIDPRVAERLHNVGFYVGVCYGCGSHREIVHAYVKPNVVEPFRDARVNVFRGNTLEPNDLPDVAMVFGGDGAMHRVLPSLAYTRTPLLVVPTGTANDFARCLGIPNPGAALRAWRRYLDCGDNVRCIDLGTVRPMAADEAGIAAAKPSSSIR